MTTSSTLPLVSVIMPVFNSAQFLSDAISSILHQTYSRFELIIIDDASTDNSLSLIKKFAKSDKRIKVIRNQINLGVSLSTNLGIRQAKGRYIAKMDSDDIAFPTRLEKQVKFLQSHPRTIALGCQCIVIDEQNNTIGHKRFPLRPRDLHDMIFWAVPIQQPSVIIDRSLLPDNFNWYSKSKSSAEDVDLLFRLIKFGQIRNLKDYLLYYRHRPNSLSHVNPKLTFRLTLQSRFTALRQGYSPSLKAILLNLIQIPVVILLPNPAINGLWNLIRGLNRDNHQPAVLPALPNLV